MNETILRKPEWLKSRLPEFDAYRHLRKILRSHHLFTVCEEARCPNMGECWGTGTATFLIMGDTCTRGCRFCAVKTRKVGQPLDVDEPENVAKAALEMGLRYVVLTSVDRDDLSDGGAEHFARTIRAIFQRSEKRLLVEVLTPDFQGKKDLLKIVLDEHPTVFAHNVETVRRLTPFVRDRRCDYGRSLDVLRWAKELDPNVITKSSLMLGLGEEEEDILQTMDDLRAVGVDILTLGQYLQPTKKHLPVKRYYSPDEFARFARIGRKKGFLSVPSGPLVRTSYRAGEIFVQDLVAKNSRNVSTEKEEV